MVIDSWKRGLQTRSEHRLSSHHFTPFRGFSLPLETFFRGVTYDLYYIKNRSLLLDIKIILKTIGVVLFGQGAR